MGELSLATGRFPVVSVGSHKQQLAQWDSLVSSARAGPWGGHAPSLAFSCPGQWAKLGPPRELEEMKTNKINK